MALVERAAAAAADTPETRKSKRRKVPAEKKEEPEESSSEDEDRMDRQRGVRQLDTTNQFVEQRRLRPGSLYKNGLSNMVKFLAPRSGSDSNGTLRARAVENLTTVGPAAHGQPGLRNERESRTLAESIDHLANGRLDSVGDVLMQRFRAVEKAVQDNGSWETARHLEIIPPALPTTLSEKERAQALQIRLREQKATAAGKGAGRDRSPH